MHGETAYIGGDLTEVAKTWASGLSGIAGEKIADGLRECIDCGEAWPPTLPEFVAMCKGKALNGFGLDYVPECYREKPIIDESRLLSSDQRDASRKSGREEVDRMKDILKGKL